MMRRDTVWKSETLVQSFLQGVRDGIPLAAEQIDVMLRLLAVQDKPIERFADLGCGSGILAAAILTRYPQARGCLVDFSEPMLAQAGRQLQAQADQVRMIATDLASPDWTRTVADQVPFDAIVSGFAIHHLPHLRKQQLYREIFDQLKPGGLFVNIEHVASPSDRMAAVFDDYMVDALYDFQVRSDSGKSREQVAAEYRQRADKDANILAPAETQCSWLREIGYQEVDCYFKAFELAVFAGRRPLEQNIP